MLDVIATPLEADAAKQLPLRARGSNQVGLRQYNERVVLNTVRLHGSLPKAELARITGLTAQTIGIITTRLAEDELIVKEEPVRGKVGQPSVPLSLNPQGAYSIGIKVGRRRCECVLVNFRGEIVKHLVQDYAFPDVDLLLPELQARILELQASLGDQADRLTGIGVAAPYQLGGWHRLLGLAPEQTERWSDFDLGKAVAQMCSVPVSFVRDTSAACVAELVNGRGRDLKNFLYIFVDTFVGGGLVLDSRPHMGLHGNAGAIASLPLGLADALQEPEQLLTLASLWELEQAYQAEGLNPHAAYDERSLHPEYALQTQKWLAQAARALAHSIVTGTAFLDVNNVVIDGSFTPGLGEALVATTQQALALYNWEGLWQPTLYQGSIGTDAIAYGGALLPLHEQFAPDHELFLKIAL